MTTEQVVKQNMDESLPLISIVVPVYNAEKTLRSCLESVCFQTVSKYEIIVVDDASTDRSPELIREFAALCPERMSVITLPKSVGLGEARKIGFENTRAPYVTFVEADGFINGVLCEVLIQKMAKDPADLCFYPVFFQRHNRKSSEVSISPRQCLNKETLLELSATSYHYALYRRSFLDTHKDTVFYSDAARDCFTAAMLIYAAESIVAYMGKILYFHVENDAAPEIQSMEVEQRKRSKQAECFEALPTDMQERCFPYLLESAMKTLKQMPALYDMQLRHIERLTKAVPSEWIKALNAQQKALVKEAKACVKNGAIPQIIYVNGWMRDEVKDMQRYLAQAAQAYLYDAQVMVLDESNCDASLLPDWIATNEDKGLFFAIRSIRRTGGIYLSPRLRLVSTFNKVAYQGAFGVADLVSGMSSLVFGARPEHPLMIALEDALLNRRWDSVRSCMSDTAVGEFGFHLDGQEERGRNDICILAQNTVFYSLDIRQNICLLDDGNLASPAPGSIVLSAEAHQAILLKVREAFKDQTALTEEQEERAKLAEEGLEKVNQSIPVRLAQPLYKTRDLIWKIIKKILKRIKR